MSKVLLTDFGSTYTKMTAVDLVTEEITGQVRVPTTANTDLLVGYFQGLDELKQKGTDFDFKLASSSAAGGLRMVAVGLVPELTSEAARRAALGAGARVEKTYSYELTQRDLLEIAQEDPDLILLAGGTDGGNKRIVLQNTERLAESSLVCPIIYAGNRAAADDVVKILTRTGKMVTVADNVMPELGKLQVEPARSAIREVFLDTIIEAKGLGKVKELMDGPLIPTPAAVLRAAVLLAEGMEGEQGLGELLVVDLGGATTDVHSIARGRPKETIVYKGLEEPVHKRTVEADLGLRVSAGSLLRSIGIDEISRHTSLDEQYIVDTVNCFTQKPDLIANKEQVEVENVLAYLAVRYAVQRHVGYLKVVDLPDGQVVFQYGKDLTSIKTVIGTGGILVYGEKSEGILKGSMFDSKEPFSLRPTTPDIYVDSLYVMAAMGLLAEKDPEKALRILKRSIKKVGSG